MKETTKKIFRSTYMPLELKYFSEQTQIRFCKFIRKPYNSESSDFLTSQAHRAALYLLLNSLRHKAHDRKENLERIRKDFEIIDCCYDPPIESFYDDYSSQVIEFFEDYTVLVTHVTEGCPPFFYQNYYNYIYNNVRYLYNVMYDEEGGKTNKLEKFGIYFQLDDRELTVLYTEKFKDGLFTPDYFKPKGK